MTTAKNKVFIEQLLENCYLMGEINFWWGGDKNLVRRKSNGGKIFPGAGDEQILGWWGGLSPVGKTMLSLT